jgi:hypothetical protein
MDVPCGEAPLVLATHFFQTRVDCDNPQTNAVCGSIRQVMRKQVGPHALTCSARVTDDQPTT